MHTGSFSFCLLHVHGCPIGQGQPHGLSQNWMAEDFRKASILGGVNDHVRRVWHQERPGVLLFCAHAGQTLADQRYLRDLLRP